jgi:hypothetical protein
MRILHPALLALFALSAGAADCPPPSNDRPPPEPFHPRNLAPPSWGPRRNSYSLRWHKPRNPSPERLAKAKARRAKQAAFRLKQQGERR